MILRWVSLNWKFAASQTVPAGGDLIQPTAKIEDGVVHLKRGDKRVQRFANVCGIKKNIGPHGLRQRRCRHGRVKAGFANAKLSRARFRVLPSYPRIGIVLFGEVDELGQLVGLACVGSE